MKVLVFAPHAGIWVHAFPEALLTDAMQRDGLEVVYVTCGGAFSSHCVTMASRGVAISADEATRQATCRDCQRNRDLLRRGFDLEGYDLESVLTREDETRIGQLVDAVESARVAEFAVDGVHLGRPALYEYLISRKKAHIELTAEDWTEFRPRLINAVRSFIAAGRILDREKPDRVLAYNTLYSVNAMWRAAATKRGIPVYFLHAGVSLDRRLQKMIVGRDSTLLWYQHLLAAWPTFRDVPCTPDELAEVTAHFEQLFAGRSVFAYSAAKGSRDIRGKFGVQGHQKLVVAAMSSYDEYIAAAAIGEMPSTPNRLFPTQIEWVRALIRWFRERPDLFLVLRVHPREFPNKREGAKSDHARQLEAAFAELPPNVRINWPTDQVSIYDLAEYADVFLNAWSSAGKEMALLGLPVVVYCPEMLLYSPDLNYVGTTQETYFAAIEQALRDGWSFERSRRAYRWCVLELVRSVIEIGDGYHFTEEAPTSLPGRALRALATQPGIQQRLDLLRRPRRLAEGTRMTELMLTGEPTVVDAARGSRSTAAETAALRTQIARLMGALYQRAPQTGRLHDHLASVARSG